MAQIVPSDQAPQEKVHYGLANFNFDLDAGGTFETEDPQLIAAAQSHPWLDVKLPEPKELSEVPVYRHVKPEDDPLTAVGAARLNNDEGLTDSGGQQINPVAINAALDQDKKVENDGGIAETLAAAEANAPDEETPRKKGGK